MKNKDNPFILFLKGTLIGFANMIAGISGGTIAYITGIFEKMVKALANITKKFWENFKYLFFILLGVAVGILVASLALSSLFEVALLETISLFAGILIGSIYSDKEHFIIPKEKRKTHYLSFALAFLFVIGLTIVNVIYNQTGETINLDGNYSETWTNVRVSQMIMLFVFTFIGTVAMIFPGISGSLVFMIFGLYYPVINEFSEIASLKVFDSWNNIFDAIKIFAPMLVAALLSLIFVSKPINILFEKHHSLCMFIIFGFVIASLFGMYVLNFQDIKMQFAWWRLLISLLFSLPLGLFLSISLHKLSKKEKIEEVE